MKIWRLLSFLMGGLLLLVLVATVPILSNLESQAVTYQIVKPSPEAALFGDVGEKIGTPQKFIIQDKKAILAEPDENGTLLLNDTYLKDQGIYPLQLQTVQASFGYARWGLAGASLLCLALGLLLSRKVAKAQSTP
ncbi:MAG: hypothetical protein MUC92_09760 [Fimbriimonadaceae bacterium]|jgi:hypothetical protein|nr:hypothetical protein [Fimbriimonadaceae bacterium]